MNKQIQTGIVPFENIVLNEGQPYNIKDKIIEQGKEITWEVVKEFVIKEIPIFGKGFAVAESISNKRQIESIIKGLQYIWLNFNILNSDLNEKLDKEFANENNPEFVLLIRRVLEEITKQYKDEKIKYLSNFIANAAMKENSSAFHKEGILEKVSNYSVEHILILKHLYDVSFQDGEVDEESRGRLQNSKISINKLDIDGIDTDVIKICFRDLESDGFIDEITGAYFNYTGGSYYLTNYGKQCIELLREI